MHRNLNAINAERVEIKAIQAGGEVFADGCDTGQAVRRPRRQHRG